MIEKPKTKYYRKYNKQKNYINSYVAYSSRVL